MGAQLAKAAGQAHWARSLTMPARVVLHHMALTAMDRDTDKTPARRYFGGYEGLILALTGEDPEGMDKDDYRRAFNRVRDAIGCLTKHNAITRIRDAAGGGRAEYEVHPDTFEEAPQ